MEQLIKASGIHVDKSSNDSLIDEPRYLSFEQSAIQVIDAYSRILGTFDYDDYIFTEVPRGTLPGKKLKNLRHAMEPLYIANRNDKCPCDSGLKFKKCCINKIKIDE